MSDDQKHEAAKRAAPLAWKLSEYIRHYLLNNHYENCPCSFENKDWITIEKDLAAIIEAEFADQPQSGMSEEMRNKILLVLKSSEWMPLGNDIICPMCSASIDDNAKNKGHNDNCEMLLAIQSLSTMPTFEIYKWAIRDNITIRIMSEGFASEEGANEWIIKMKWEDCNATPIFTKTEAGK